MHSLNRGASEQSDNRLIPLFVLENVSSYRGTPADQSDLLIHSLIVVTSVLEVAYGLDVRFETKLSSKVNHISVNNELVSDVVCFLEEVIVDARD